MEQIWNNTQAHSWLTTYHRRCTAAQRACWIRRSGYDQRMVCTRWSSTRFSLWLPGRLGRSIRRWLDGVQPRVCCQWGCLVFCFIMLIMLDYVVFLLISPDSPWLLSTQPWFSEVQAGLTRHFSPRSDDVQRSVEVMGWFLTAGAPYSAGHKALDLIIFYSYILYIYIHKYK